MATKKLKAPLTEAPELPTDEQLARQWRVSIYGPISDASWANCKDKWLEPPAFEWLRKTAEKDSKKAAPANPGKA